MAFLISTMLLVLAGAIHSSPVPGNFSFEVSMRLEVISVRFGEDAVFNCKTNDPSANVTFKVLQWHSNQPSNLPPQPGKITRDGTTFTVHNIIIHDSGKYRCVAENQNGKVIKRDILLTIDTRYPEIAIIPFISKRILYGSDLTYACEGTMGSVGWYKIVKGSAVRLPMASLPGVSVKSSFGTDKIVREDLIISNADSSHSGVYECELEYRGLSVEKRVQVDVTGPERAKIVRSSNQEIWAQSGKDLEIVCIASGFPRPTLTWIKDNQVIPKCHEDEPCAKSEQYRYIMTGYALKIKKPRYPDDDAKFYCKAENAYGQDLRPFVVVVPRAPVMDKSLSGKIYNWRKSDIGRSIYIPCAVSEASPVPDFSWSFMICSPNSCKDWKTCKDHGLCTKWSLVEDPFKVRSLAYKSTLEVHVPKDFLRVKFFFNCTAKNGIGKASMVAGLFEG